MWLNRFGIHTRITGDSGNTVYTSAGSGTFTVPFGVFTLYEEVIGGGGGGTGSSSGNGGAGAGGGGGGAWRIRTVSPGEEISFTVGAGGSPNSNGSNSIIGTMYATGGFKGLEAGYGQGGRGYNGTVNGIGGGSGGGSATTIGGGGGAGRNDDENSFGGAGAGGGGDGGDFISGNGLSGEQPGGGGAHGRPAEVGSGASGRVRFAWGPDITI
jgi:hypothetical protein